MADKDKLLNSNYDGIEEYDNDLPRWWVWLFIITIIFAVIYPVYYHITPGITNEKQLAMDMAEIQAMQGSSQAAAHKRGEADLIALSKAAAALESGKATFAAKCVVCHAPDGGGLVGPNLTDTFWIHGGKLEQIRTTVENGVLEKGMLAWKGQLSPEEIDNVVAYVWSLQGTTPANPKAAQGNDESAK